MGRGEVMGEGKMDARDGGWGVGKGRGRERLKEEGERGMGREEGRKRRQKYPVLGRDWPMIVQRECLFFYVLIVEDSQYGLL